MTLLVTVHTPGDDEVRGQMYSATLTMDPPVSPGGVPILVLDDGTLAGPAELPAGTELSVTGEVDERGRRVIDAAARSGFRFARSRTA
jgi:hypothetical protein